MTLKGGTSQACAACKYQRKRCTPECPLAPHFRPEQTEIFKNAHKLFGVKNILKILEKIEPAQKTEAMRSIIYESNMRERFPVHGCLGIVYQLQFSIKHAEKELIAALSQLEFYKRQQVVTFSSSDHQSLDDQLQLGIGVVVTDHQNNNNNHNNNYNSNDNNVNMTINSSYNSGHDEGYTNVMWGSTVDNEPQFEVTHDYDDIYPFLDDIDSKGSSSESSLKNSTITHVEGDQFQVNKYMLSI